VIKKNNMSIPDYYLTLRIEDSASQEEIKRAFRRLAKKFHPDKNPGNEKTAEKRFKQITKAYKVLCNRESRAAYDQLLKTKRDEQKDCRRENLRRKAKNDTGYLCQLILFELLNQNSSVALDMYDGLIAGDRYFSLEPFMNDSDLRDCEFLLAEAYHKRGDLSEAAKLYEKVLVREKKKAYFRNFTQEIEHMLRDVYLQNIAKAEKTGEILDNMRKIMAMDISKRDIAQVYKKSAEAFYRINDIDNARNSLKKAFYVDPKLKGAKKIAEKLGIEER
jgi:curved DNA-binding protein CbpA